MSIHAAITRMIPAHFRTDGESTSPTNQPDMELMILEEYAEIETQLTRTAFFVSSIKGQIESLLDGHKQAPGDAATPAARENALQSLGRGTELANARTLCKRAISKLDTFYEEALTCYLGSINVETTGMTALGKMNYLKRQIALGQKPAFYDTMTNVDNLRLVLEDSFFS